MGGFSALRGLGVWRDRLGGRRGLANQTSTSSSLFSRQRSATSSFLALKKASPSSSTELPGTTNNTSLATNTDDVTCDVIHSPTSSMTSSSLSSLESCWLQKLRRFTFLRLVSTPSTKYSQLHVTCMYLLRTISRLHLHNVYSSNLSVCPLEHHRQKRYETRTFAHLYEISVTSLPHPLSARFLLQTRLVESC